MGSLTIQISGARAGTTLATWGQRSIWRWHGMADGDPHPVHGWQYPLPDGCDLHAVEAAIADVVHRHDALRSVFPFDGETLRQVVQGDGEVRVEVYRADDDEHAGTVGAEAAQRLAGPRFERAEEWPLRLAVVTVGPAARYLVVSSNRLALDGHGLAIVVDELMRTCAGETVKPPSWQPIEEAGFEQSPRGQAVAERANEYWHRVLSAAPVSMFDFPAQPERDEMRFRVLRMDSPALAAAADVLQRRTRATISAQLMAATAVVLGRYTGHDSVVMQIIAGNRMGSDRRDMVGSLSSEGLFHLDVSGLSFDQLMRQAFRASGSAQQFGFGDPDGFWAARRRVRAGRGANLDLGALVNDIQAPQPERDDGPEPTADELRRLTRRTTVAVVGGWPNRPTGMDLRFFLGTLEGPDMPLTLFCDTRQVPADTMRQMLEGIERLLVHAATQDVPAADVGRIAGVTPVRRPAGWVRHDGGWIDLAASRRSWQEVAGRPATLLVDEGCLVGCLAGGDRPDFAALHRAAVAAVGDRTDVRAPLRYRWIADAPADPADERVWWHADVLAADDVRLV